ncbi:MAG: Abi family protein [Propionibacteriaceae bacterium]|nr:Abi family protein [Propionibacteriaceae bacterium]
MTSSASRAQLEQWISADRFSKYLTATNCSDPVALYEWNSNLASAAFEIIGHTEVLLRNAIHRHLAARSGQTSWYDDASYGFNGQTRNDIANAKSRARSQGGRLTGGRVVAQLSFGFWRYMLSSTYQATVWPRASRAFQGVPRSQRDRRTIERMVIGINNTRNRIAHAESVFDLPADRLEKDIIDFAALIDPKAAAWIKSISRVGTVLAVRPE